MWTAWSFGGLRCREPLPGSSRGLLCFRLKTLRLSFPREHYLQNYWSFLQSFRGLIAQCPLAPAAPRGLRAARPPGRRGAESLSGSFQVLFVPTVLRLLSSGFSQCGTLVFICGFHDNPQGEGPCPSPALENVPLSPAALVSFWGDS